ncbi:MAG: elongation factor Ts [Thermonema sp.]|uniref:translation elongation factor Ts n=1 Tax=Thermonema sp. TaxID=2231181 RepID=UPI0021DE830B|nr:translation elongation factor Ts [Thermonema sp.]GIV40408.1 MAG: elongation factor Ts [Thermonema sp.]
MAITAQDVNKLRQMTGMGMMDCKKALQEAEGDFDKAIEILRKKGEKISLKRADNETKEGVVFIYNTGTEAAAFAFSCETEPVAKNTEFRGLGEAILEAVKANKPKTKEEVENLTLPSGQTVKEAITELMGKIGEKLTISDYVFYTGEQIVEYLHSNEKVGVLVVFEGVNGADLSETGKDIAMQIAAMKPIAIDKDGVDPAIVEKELEVAREQVRQEGKPEELVDKIAQGKLNKFFQEHTLLNQKFVKDDKKTVAQVLKEAAPNAKVVAFKRLAIA